MGTWLQLLSHHRLLSFSNSSVSVTTADKRCLMPQLHERVMEIGPDRGAAESVDQCLLYLHGSEFPSHTLPGCVWHEGASADL